MVRLLTYFSVAGLLLIGGTSLSRDLTQDRARSQTHSGADAREADRSKKKKAHRRSDSGALSQFCSSSDSVVVVELFTSEGCSSCPPADRLLRSLVERARTEGKPVYALSFHVDYWNRLGWEDPYSDAAYSRRQRQYSRALNVDTYTPQIVVNGREAMVGSRTGRVRDAIESALSEPARVAMNIQIKDADGLSVQYTLSDAPPENATLQLAVVERGLSQEVTRGENAGRTLRHANVVRRFETLSARRQGTVQLAVPEAVDRSQASVIGYVQNPSRAVIGAARADLNERSPTSAR